MPGRGESAAPLAGSPPAVSTDLIVIGASAGGVEALRGVVAGLAPGLPAPVVVVLHIPRDAPSALAGILDRSGALPAVTARHDEPLRDGVVHVAPADHHVLVADGRVQLSRGAAENGHRPAVDPLFRSAAAAYGAGAVGVVLSGARDDGTAGLATIVGRGGVALVQDPKDALHASMPASALRHVPSAHVHPAAKIGAALGDLLADPDRPRRPPDPVDPLLAAETAIAALAPLTTDRVQSAQPSALSCPSCHGILFELPGAPSPRFRCRVGHAYSPDSLAAEQAESVEQALWAALRAIEEKMALLRRLADGAEEAGRPRSAAAHRGRVQEAERDAALVRGLVARGPAA